MNDKAQQLDWNGWLEKLEKSQIPNVVRTLDELNQADDCLSRLYELQGVITWSKDARIAINNLLWDVRQVRKKILAIPMEKR